MSGRLYRRAVEVHVSSAEVGKYFKTTEHTTIRDLRVKFSVQKHLGKEPNSASVTIFNLAERTRAEFMAKPLSVRLSAGYEGSLKELFKGDLVWGTSSKPDVTWLTEMQLGDGQRAYKHARSSRSFKAGTTAKTVLKDLAGTMGLKMPASVDDAKELLKQFTTGVSIDGPSQKEISRMMSVTGHDWSTQNGKLQILKKGKANKIEPWRVAQDTGMVGRPVLGAPTKPKAAPVLAVRMLMAGYITPGDPIILDTKQINGLYKVQRINSTGDTEGAEWYSDIEATAL